jgi:outer membrane protein assembly factor BamB
VKLPAKPGDRFDAQPLWSTSLDSEVFASAVCSDGLLYVVDARATFYVLDVKDGQLVYSQPLDIPTGASGGIFGSIALAGGNIILGNCTGNLVVLAPGRQFTLLQSNNLDGGEGCCPAFAGKQMFLRVNESLVCIARN